MVAHPEDNNSSFAIIEQLKEKECFLFTNDFDCIYDEVEDILRGDYDQIIMLGQKPLIKDIRVERQARFRNEILYTDFDLEKVEEVLS